MGDRANIHVKGNSSDDTGVYLYTHWDGEELPQTLYRALSRRARWNDTQYLTRIIFCEMIKGHEGGETGYGISGFLGDGIDRILEVNPDEMTVTEIHGKRKRTWTFEAYVSRNPDTIEWGAS